MRRRPSRTNSRPVVGIVVLGFALALAPVVGCSSDGASDDAAASIEVDRESGSEGGDASGSGPVDTDGSAASSTESVDDRSGDATDETSASDEATGQTSAPETLPELGVPGLDSDLVVCRGWSRFAGSFQVAAVAASFGADPLDAARLEVVSSTVVVDAVGEMIDNWPDELADDAEAVADGLLGPYARRSARALDELVAAGAEPADLDALAAIWLDALAVRDPTEVVPVLELPDRLAAIVASAASAFDAALVPIPADPSLVTDVDVPRSEEFLFETCPDRGTLAGTEIDP